jgi:hypothetical protein
MPDFIQVNMTLDVIKRNAACVIVSDMLRASCLSHPHISASLRPCAAATTPPMHKAPVPLSRFTRADLVASCGLDTDPIQHT